MTSFESVPDTWDDARDTAFFTVAARLFSPAFAAGSSVLLGSYDVEPQDAQAGMNAAPRTGTGRVLRAVP